MAQTKIKAGLFEGIIGNGTDGYFLMSNGDGTMTWSSIIINPTIASIAYPGSVTAADPAGGETITVTGTGFKTGATVTIGGTAAPAVSYVSTSQITFTTPAKAAGDYDIVVTNTDTGSATFINGISYNGIPSWTTAAGSLGTFASGATISTITLQATEPDAGTITFNITNGALPTGLSLTGANIDGTTSLETADTLYTFTVTATDDESQVTPRTFTITVTKQFISTENFTINTYTGNGSTQSIEGKIGTAASFNGSSSKILLPKGMVSNTEDISVSFWVQGAVAPSSSYRVIYQGDGNDYFYITVDTSGEIRVYPDNYLDPTYSRYTTQLATTNSNITDGDWHHIVVVNKIESSANGGGYKIYVDGSENASASFSSTLRRDPGESYGSSIGSSNSGTASYYEGRLDQVRIFNKALSSSEVTTLYGESNTSSTKSTTDIFDDGFGVALYEFEKGAIDTGGVTGYIGSGGIFNGSSSLINLGSTNQFASSGVTVSMWINTNSVTTNQILIANGNGGSFAEGDLQITIRSDGYIGYEIGQSSSIYESRYATTTQLSADTWHHILMTFDSSLGTTIGRIYVDNTLQSTTAAYTAGGTFSGDVFIGTLDLQLGKRNVSGTEYWYNGKMDQVRIFNKALSTNEIATLYGETSASATKSTTDIFDDGSGVALYELEGNANDTGSDNGKFGKAAIFDGNGYIALDGLQTSSNMSVSFWMKTQTTMTTYQMILELSNGYGIVRPGFAANGKIYAQYANSNSAHVASTSTLPVGEWVHVVGTFTSSSANLYINNVSQSGGTITDYLTADQNTIGSRRSDGFFTGSIDDVRIYSDILTTTEIGYLYNNDTANIPTGNLIAYYKLDGNSTDEQGSYNGVDTNVSYAYNGTATNVAYAYNGTATNVNYLGMAFQPDLVWIKERTSTSGHHLGDSVRGATKMIYSNLTNAEGTEVNTITSFDSNGFGVGNSVGVNENTQNYVAWAWKAGGTAVSNTDGSITSTVSANQDAGFSIVEYTGTGANATVGHGLSSAPELIIIKRTDNPSSWSVYPPLGSNYIMFLNASDAAYSGSSIWWNNTDPTSSVFTIGTYNVHNASSSTNIAYCFHSVDGYQKIGSYTGTGSSGNVVTTGFRPRFVMYKSTTGATAWVMIDSARGEGTNGKYLFANTSGAEGTYTIMDFTDTGFTLQDTDNTTNGSGQTYIYLAIA